MRQRHYGRRLAPLFTVLALLAAACGGGGDDVAEPADSESADPTDAATESAADESATEEDTAAAEEPSEVESSDAAEAPAEGSGGTYSVYLGEPEHLIPTNAAENQGSEVLFALFSGLVDYDPETNEPLLGDDAPRAMAASIESEDQQNWTITLKDGFTFHNGDPVTAQSFVDSWNFGAYQPNAQQNSYFFANIEGYDALQCAEDQLDADGLCTGEPEASEMSGLTAPDDSTIEVTLNEVFSQFPLTVGYTAFFPMPDAAFEDPEAFEQQPIGNGPFMMSGAWDHNVAINVERYPDYGGEPAAADAIEFRIYADVLTAYTDLQAGSLDILEDVPGEQIEAAQAEFGERFLEGESSSFTYIGFPVYDERFQNPDLRMAMSMAIDRQAITDTIRLDSVPADAFISPVVQGYREGACGAACEYDPEAARALFDSAGGIEGDLTVWFNSGADHDVWIEAVSNNWRQNLGIENIAFEQLDFSEYLPLLDAEEVTGPFRLGWVMDYPSPQNYLEPIHATDGSSNNTGYSNPEFDDLVAQGNAAPTVEEGIEFYSQAEDILAADVPLIPMFFGRTAGAHSENVEGVISDAFTRLNSADITVVSG